MQGNEKNNKRNDREKDDSSQKSTRNRIIHKSYNREDVYINEINVMSHHQNSLVIPVKLMVDFEWFIILSLLQFVSFTQPYFSF